MYFETNFFLDVQFVDLLEIRGVGEQRDDDGSNRDLISANNHYICSQST